MRHSLGQVLAAAMLAIALNPAARAMAQAAPVDLRILAINDFHGYLRPPAGGIRIADPDDKTKKITVAAGGAEQMATLVRQLRQGAGNNIFVAAGDLIGASPFLSAMFHNEPTIESLSMMGLEITSVGNHEFDEGKEELLRMQNGGCHPTDGCQGPHRFPGARFHYLAASTFDSNTGKTVLPPYEIRQFEGIPVAFIGLTLKGTPDIVSPAGVAGLEFRDEADTVNALVPELKARGVEAIVVLIHEGGYPTGDYNECPGISGAIVDIVKKFDRAVDLVISGHTHQAYVCEIDGRLVTSGDKYGTIVTAIDLKLDPVTRDVISAKLEQQWLDPKRPRILQVSRGFSYSWDGAKSYGDRVAADRMSLNRQRIDPAMSYRVTVNNYLAVGGDGFTVLKDGTAQQFGIYDADALYGYFQANSPIAPTTADRIARLN
jgi:5'-nucleotidase